MLSTRTIRRGYAFSVPCFYIRLSIRCIGALPPAFGSPLIVCKPDLCCKCIGCDILTFLWWLCYDTHGWGAGSSCSKECRRQEFGEKALSQESTASSRGYGEVLDRSLIPPQPLLSITCYYP